MTKKKKPEELLPMGRPSDYKPEYCERVVELGRVGKSKAQIAADLDVARNTLDNWAADHPDFLSALTRARDLALAAWEDKAERGIESIGFNASLWGRVMSARFPDDYREVKSTEVTGKGGKDLVGAQPTLVIGATTTPQQIGALVTALGLDKGEYDT